jgi:hypothetical protein
MKPVGIYLPASLVAVICLFTPGCSKNNNCGMRPAEAEIKINLAAAIQPQTIQQMRVILTINGQKALKRHFTIPRPAFVFEFQELDRPPRLMTIVAQALDGKGLAIGEGQLTTDFYSDGCNFFTVTVLPTSFTPDGGTTPLKDAQGDVAHDASSPTVDAKVDSNPAPVDAKQQPPTKDSALDLTSQPSTDQSLDLPPHH